MDKKELNLILQEGEGQFIEFKENFDSKSIARENITVNVTCSENARLNKVVGEMLKIVRSNRQRHSVVEKMMIYCDRDTVAVEVLVWYWDRKKNFGVCEHIDVLQVKYGKVWILDYKPDAEKENFASVVSQLYHYTIALSFRAKLDIRDIGCGWFDSVKTCWFEPGKVCVDWKDKKKVGR